MQNVSNAVEAHPENVIRFPQTERSAIIPAQTLYTIGAFGLSGGAKWLYIILRSHTNKNGECRLFYETLAAESGQTVRTTRRKLAELRKAGLIESRRNGRSRANDFKVTMTPGKPAKSGHLSHSSPPKTGHFLPENRPERVKKQAKSGHSFKEQAKEQVFKQASLASNPHEKFNSFSFPERSKKAFFLHRKKNPIGLFVETIQELEDRNAPSVLLKALEKYIEKGQNGDIYPVSIVRDYLWKEIECETVFDIEEERGREEERKCEEERNRIEEEECEKELEILERRRRDELDRALKAFTKTAEAIEAAVLKQDQNRVREIIKTDFDTIVQMKRAGSETAEWKRYREYLLAAGFVFTGAWKGTWKTPLWDREAARAAVESLG